jgi:cell shape-determining protein MreC
MLKILLIILSLNSAFAYDCSKNVHKAQAGTTINCPAWIVSDKQMQEFVKVDEENPLLKEKISLQEKKLFLTETELEIYKDNNKALKKEVSKMERKSFYTNVGYFVLGALLTGFAAKVAIETTK